MTFIKNSSNSLSRHDSLCLGWKDVWVGDLTLERRFNRLYHLDLDNNCLVSDRFVDGRWIWRWNRSDLSGRQVAEIEELGTLLQHIQVSDGIDGWCFDLDISQGFVVSTLRDYIDEKILPSLQVNFTWFNVLPRKVNIFIWRLALDKLPTRLNLSMKGLEIQSIACPICGYNVESGDHTFFSCSLADQIWLKIRLWTNCNLPTFTSWNEWFLWFEDWYVVTAKKIRLMAIVAASLWCIWIFRSDTLFSGSRPKKDCLFDNICNFSFHWVKYRGKQVSSRNIWLLDPL
ncbi:uncharacterized protein [Rutidosis leptorrhynchoides]|uniref:uncharacterized protein n=1 Tax=Rutidosis leptorrhynchoides TaxID=125765 RepID=UPI003A98CF9F